jgi:CheY-like chemotaxis protein
MSIMRQINRVIPVILISAESDDNLLHKALSAHAFCVLAKPVSKNVVIYVVTRALEKYY